jgi:hypothetical protein
MFDGKIIPSEPHGPPSKFGILALALIKVGEGGMVSYQSEGSACQVAVKLLKGINYCQKFPISGPQPLLRLGTCPRCIADDVVLAILV